MGKRNDEQTFHPYFLFFLAYNFSSPMLIALEQFWVLFLFLDVYLFDLRKVFVLSFSRVLKFMSKSFLPKVLKVKKRFKIPNTGKNHFPAKL
jgi:hypothetical protein